MPQAAQAAQRRSRREVVSWASADELEVLRGIGEAKQADWTVLTLERDAPVAVDGETAEPPAAVAADVLGDHREVGHVGELRDAGESPVPATPAAAAAASAPRRHADPGRRTVVIRGQGTHQPVLTAERRRPAPRPRDRVGHRPDRIALWAVALGLLLILVAATTANAAPLV